MTLRELLSVYNGRQFRICILEEQKWLFYDMCAFESEEKREEIKKYKEYKVHKFEPCTSNGLEGYITITI